MEPIDLLENVLKKDSFLIHRNTIEQFSLYRDLLLDWNQRMNLISHSDEGRILTRHFLQSIGLLKFISFPTNCSVMDIGSGAGFPGIPLKLIRPDIYMILAESIKKKASFLEAVISSMNLQNIRVVARRIDSYSRLNNPVDFVVARSVTNLSNLIRWSFPSLKPDGKLIAIKGSNVEKELNEVKETSNKLQFAQSKIISYNPFPDVFTLSESFIVIIDRYGHEI